MIPHIYNGNGTISLMIDGVMKPVDTAHKNYAEIKEALKNKLWDVIPSLVNIKAQVEDAINRGTARGKVSLVDGEVYYNGTRVHNTLTDRIVAMAKEDFDIGHMVKFLENLMDNPSYRAVNELYDFLEAGSIPITENGTFLTYKKIRSDWKDIHSATFDNSIGAVCEMPRNMVDEDSSRTCSNGLHVCSYAYLPHFGSCDDNRVVICEVNPADVVSIPADYNNTKMRVSRYTVIGEVEDYKEEDFLAKNAVVYTTSIRVDVKNIGKEVSASLQNGDIDPTQLETILYDCGINGYVVDEIVDIAEDGDYKRVGKKIAYYISSGTIDATTFVNEFEAMENSDEVRECARCGEELNPGDSECNSCGYYN